MRTHFCIIGTVAILSHLVSSLEILGLKVPEFKVLSDMEREPGMPLVHDEAKHVLGRPHLAKNDTVFLGCAESTDDLDHPCHPKNIALKATHAGRVITDVPLYGVLT